MKDATTPDFYIVGRDAWETKYQTVAVSDVATKNGKLQDRLGNVPGLLEALRDMKTDYEVNIVGDGLYLGTVKKLAKDWKLPVNILGFIDLLENPDIFEKPTGELRDVLLSLNGVGEETADSIVLYAADKPKFVIDAYTKRMCKCIGIDGNYGELQSIFEDSLPIDVPLYKEFHAPLILLQYKNHHFQKISLKLLLLQFYNFLDET